MKMHVFSKVTDYFKSTASLIVAVNTIARCMNLSELKGFEVSNSTEQMTLIEIDEDELCDSLLEDEKLFALVALYAMGMGE